MTQSEHELKHEELVKLREQLRRYSVVLDDAFTVPGTGIKLGWDSIIGLIPGIGDATGAILSSVIVLQGIRMKIPRHRTLQMLGNIGIETLIGIIPGLGDIFDVAWRANRKNFAIIEKHLDKEIELARQKIHPMKDVTPPKDEREERIV